MDAANAYSYHFIRFNFKKDNNKVLRIKIRVHRPGHGVDLYTGFRFYDASETWNNLDYQQNNPNYDDEDDDLIYFEVIFSGAGNDCDYYIYEETTLRASDTTASTASTDDWDYFDEIEVNMYDDDNAQTGDRLTGLIDDIEIDIDDSFEEEAPTYDVSGYDYYGDLSCNVLFNDGSGIENRANLETKRNVKMSTTIRAVDLLVSQKQFNDCGDLSAENYYLRISGAEYEELNNYTLNPVAFIPYGSNYLLRWYHINATLYNAYPILEFYHADNCIDGVNCWEVYTSTLDNDNDGDVEFYTANNINYWGDSTYFGTEHQDLDLCVRVYYDPETTYETGDQDYTDDISTTESTYYTYENVLLNYKLSSKIYDNSIHIEKDGVPLTIHNYPRNVSTWSGVEGFVPLASGTYGAILKRNGVKIVYCNFTVTDIPDSNFWLYTTPNPTNQFQDYDVHFRYNHSSKHGALFMQYSSSLKNPNSAIYKFYFDETEYNHTFTYYPSTAYNQYWFLCVEIEDNVYTPVVQYVHYVRGGFTDNEIVCSYPNLYTDTDVNYGTQLLIGHHNHIGSTVVIKDNGVQIKDVSTIPQFTYSYKVYDSGDHLVQLVAETENGSWILAYDTYTFGETEDDEQQEAWEEAIEGYQIYLGAGIIVLMILLPVFLSMKFYIDIPLIVYISMAMVGTGIATGLGYIPMYWLLIMLVAMVTGAIIVKFG
jgi:hypothetical protein